MNQPERTTNPQPLPVPPLSPTPQNSILMGRFGMRAGWGILIVAAVWFVCMVFGEAFAIGATGHIQQFAAAQAPGTHTGFHIPITPLYVLIYDGVPFAGVLAVCWLLSRAERRQLADFGLGIKRAKDALAGAFWGIVLLSLLVFTLWSLHVLVFDGIALHGSAVILYGSKWLIAFIAVAFAEEYVFRGYVQFTLMRGLWGLAERLHPADPRPFAFWCAATFWSLMFSLLHMTNAGETFFGIVAVFLAGMTFSYTLWRTGSLWWGIGFHASWDWAQSYLYGVADSGTVNVGRLLLSHPTGKPLLSGGADGPEGSLLVIAALALAVGAVHFTSRGAQPTLEQGLDRRNLPPQPAPPIP